MASLRAIAGCIGIGGNFSVVRDFYGYQSGVYGHLPLDIDLQTLTMAEAAIDPSAPGKLSLLKQITLLKGLHIHLDIIRVAGEDFTAPDLQEIDIAVQMTRELFARIGLGIGRVLPFFIPKADAGGHEILDSECEAIDLIDEWTADGGGIDAFFVRDITYGKGGGAPDKGDGIVLKVSGTIQTGIGLAHELAHFMDNFHHLPYPTFLLYEKFPKPPYDLTPGEIAKMKNHADVQGGCP